MLGQVWVLVAVTAVVAVGAFDKREELIEELARRIHDLETRHVGEVNQGPGAPSGPPAGPPSYRGIQGQGAPSGLPTGSPPDRGILETRYVGEVNQGPGAPSGPPAGPPSYPSNTGGGPSPPGPPAGCLSGPDIGVAQKRLSQPHRPPCQVFLCLRNFQREKNQNCHAKFQAGAQCAKNAPVSNCHELEIEEVMKYFQRTTVCGCKDEDVESCLLKIRVVSNLLAESPAASLSERRAAMTHAESCVRRIEYYGVSTEGCEAMFPSGGHYIMVLLHAWSYGCDAVYDLLQNPKPCGEPVKYGCSGGEREIDEFLGCAERLFRSSRALVCRSVLNKRAQIKRHLLKEQERSCRDYTAVQEKLSEC